MRNLILSLFFTMCTCSAFGNYFHKETSDTDTKKVETLDTTFIDFFENFIWDEDFQKSRVKFPIQINKQSIPNSQKWKQLSFDIQSDYIPFLFSDTVTIVDKDIVRKKIQLCVLNFDKKSTEKYNFTKIKGNWFLEKMENTNSDLSADPEFIRFLTKFSSDPKFQTNSISFPLKDFYTDEENDYESALRIIQKKDWKQLRLTDEIKTIFVFSDIDIKNKYRNIFFRGLGNGIWVKYTFERINKNWKLIKIENYSI